MIYSFPVSIEMTNKSSTISLPVASLGTTKVSISSSPTIISSADGMTKDFNLVTLTSPLVEFGRYLASPT